MAEDNFNYLGIDIGTNSVGSAWVDMSARDVHLAVSVFPSGVEETEDKRGAPKNQARRQSRSQRRNISRRSKRKRILRRKLIEVGLLPAFGKAFDHDEKKQNPWELRRDGLTRSLTPHEFGRVLIHLNQRRGALGVSVDEEDRETDGEVKKAIAHLNEEMGDRTFGQFMADLFDERKHAVNGKSDKHFRSSIRNRRDFFEYHATRDLIRKEFCALWDAQKGKSGKTASLLSEELKIKLDNSKEDGTWREKGLIFGQRRTYWKTGTLGRCDLEPTDHRCSIADRHVQEFRVLETVNNIRVKWADEDWHPLCEAERKKIIDKLRTTKAPGTATIKTALGIKKAQRAFFSLNLDADPDREINSDWFCREIVHEVFGTEKWESLQEIEKESVNRALLKFDPDKEEHAFKFRAGAKKWWNLPEEKIDNLIQAWTKRPKLDKRINLSRRAVQNLLPIMRECDPRTCRWPTVTEARQLFAENPSNHATPEQRVRYAFTLTESLQKLLIEQVGNERMKELLRLRGTSKKDRHYIRKHPEDVLPPAPMLANPVVRKAIHEVRRHLIMWMRKFGRKPDRIIIELIKSARQSAKVRNSILSRNRERNKIKKGIIEQQNLATLSLDSQEAAIERVLLCRQQRGVCPYTGKTITEKNAADGLDVEVDHIIPKSRSWDNSYSNKVLCCRKANRKKKGRTPKEWLTEDDFAQMLKYLGHLEKDAPAKGDYFTKKENARKWENLNRATPELGEFLNSQFTDTAYAAKQVMQWLNDSLYGDEDPSKRYVFTTKGKYTSILRKDWQLQDAKGPKERKDHRHHAIDALVIALSGPERIQELSSRAGEQERFHEKFEQWSRRDPITSPWEDVSIAEFRKRVMEKVNKLVVAHRPIKRKIIKWLHLDKPYGEAMEYPGLYCFKLSVVDPKTHAVNLKPNQLRPPKKNVSSDGTVTYSIKGKGQGSVVRNPGLRKAIRQCLRENGIDPDNFTEKDVKSLTVPENYKLRLPSGVPIYDIRMVRTLSKPKPILRCGKRSDGVERFYQVSNNHHVEIVEDLESGKWSLECVDMFDAARRVNPPKSEKKQPLVKRSHGPGKKFIMSLAEGEVLYMKSPPMTRMTTNEFDYFVVFEINDKKINFLHHTDARPATARKNPKTGMLEETREEISLSAAQLKALSLPNNEPPRKVRIKLPGNRENPEDIQFLDHD
ncbi:MAG: type II CRISPR RNA-guided endonuclease Cas9 [Pirellulales bacterium]|nr:type II CRISPR RNA-guided endonuclease Cas9 [Pirellulales bacterium]